MKKKDTDTSWRIPWIPYKDPMQPMETNWRAVVGTLCFIAGIVLFLRQRQPAWLILSGAGFLAILLSLLLKGRKIRRNWRRVQARCIDQEIKQVWSRGPGNAKTWRFCLLCEFELAGQTYRVTPSFWRTFATETGVSGFLAKVVSPRGLCELHVNPQNPLQAELIAHDVKDTLLHG